MKYRINITAVKPMSLISILIGQRPHPSPELQSKEGNRSLQKQAEHLLQLDQVCPCAVQQAEPLFRNQRLRPSRPLFP